MDLENIVRLTILWHPLLNQHVQSIDERLRELEKRFTEFKKKFSNTPNALSAKPAEKQEKVEPIKKLVPPKTEHPQNKTTPVK